jgi:hypothetical protein
MAEKSLPQEYTDASRHHEVAKKAAFLEAPLLRFVGSVATEGPVFRQPTAVPANSVFGGSVSSCHRELIEPARA